jgi:predicted flap endonuclease-1-like 5' DNA nuclease
MQDSKTFVSLVMLAAALVIALDRMGWRLPSWMRWFLVAILGILAVRFQQQEEIQTGQPVVPQPKAKPQEVPPTPTKKSAAKAKADDLTVLEGIGPKMAAALTGAGIATYEKLARTSEADLRTAIQAAGMRLAPSLTTWAKQAEYAARGDWDGMQAYQQTLNGGHKK